jgi:hypothetical protein
VNDIELTEDDLQRVTGGADSGIKHIAYGVGAMGPAGGTNGSGASVPTNPWWGWPTTY